MAKGVGRAEADRCGDLLDRQLRRFEQAASLGNPCLQNPLAGREAGRLHAAPDQGSPAHASLRRETVDRQILVEVPAGPCQYVAEPIALPRHRMRDELRLSAAAKRGDDEAAGGLVGDFDAAIAPHDVQTQIEPGGTAGRSQDIAFVDVKR